jgi:septal ring factor EnvC (AmiA/AmiB activator)
MSKSTETVERIKAINAGVELLTSQRDDARRERDNLSRMVDRLSDGLADARRERDEAREELASEELASEGRWRDTYQLKVIELERQLTAANRALVWVTAYPKSRQRGLAPSDVVVAIDSARAAEGGEG